MERSNKPSEFENEWRDAFEGASRTPSPRVWEGIESSLDSKKSRKGAWIWWVAASLFLAVSVGGGVLYFGSGDGNGSPLAVEQPASDDLSGQDSDSSVTDDGTTDIGTTLAGDDSNSPDAASRGNKQNIPALAQNNTADSKGSGDIGNGLVSDNSLAGISENKPSGNQSSTYLPEDNEPVSVSQSIAYNEDGSSEASSVREDIPGWEEVNGEAGDISLARLDAEGPLVIPADLEKASITVYRVPDNAMFAELDDEGNKKPWEDEKLWTGLSFAGGSFDPSFKQRPGTQLPSISAGRRGNGARLADEPDIDQEVEPTFSYDLNFNVAGMLGKRFVWQSGISYQRMNAASNTAIIFQDVPSQVRYPILLSNAKAPQLEGYKQKEWINNEIETINAFEFLTVPVKLGYVFGGEKVQFLVSTGVSANFFLANTITSENPSAYGSFETRPGDDINPFKRVTLNGLLSGELLYRLSSSFSISAGPMFQYSLDNLARDEALFDSKPSSILISTGIKYHIR